MIPPRPKRVPRTSMKHDLPKAVFNPGLWRLARKEGNAWHIVTTSASPEHLFAAASAYAHEDMWAITAWPKGPILWREPGEAFSAGEAPDVALEVARIRLATFSDALRLHLPKGWVHRKKLKPEELEKARHAAAQAMAEIKSSLFEDQVHDL